MNLSPDFFRFAQSITQISIALALMDDEYSVVEFHVFHPQMLFTLFTLTIVSPQFCRANDSAIEGTSGRPGSLKAHALKGEHSSVRMVSEEVNIQIGASDYVTDARFVFHNDGAAQTVRMGFPEGAGSDSDFAKMKSATSFKSFATWVDGQRVHARRMVDASSEDDFSFDAYWVKSVPFTRGQTRRVRLLYRSPLGSTTDSNYIFYDFTGGNWKGKVRHSILNVTFKTPGTYRIWPTFEKSIPATRQLPNGYKFFWSNWQAQENFAVRFAGTLPNEINEAFERKSLNENSEIYSGVKLLKFRGESKTAREKLDPWQVVAKWPPNAVLRDGRVFIKFRQFDDSLKQDF